MKQVTIKDIAREAGVSIASVSRALNGMDGISEENRSRILRVCERLSYTPNGLARSLVKRRTQTIGIIMPDIMSPFYSELMVKASDAAHKRGYQVLLCNSFRELKAERDYLKLLAEHQVEGILIFPIGPRSTESMAEFIHNVPMVALNELTGQCGIPYVCADEEQAGRSHIQRVQEPAVCGVQARTSGPPLQGRQFSGDSQGKADSGPGIRVQSGFSDQL